MLQPGLHGGRTEIVDLDHEIDWPTAHLAVFDVFLLLDRCVDQQSESLPAVGALDYAFDELIDHDAGRIRSIRPLSVAK